MAPEAATREVIYEGPHTRRLAALLAMDAMGPAELKRAIPKVIPRELAYMMPDGTIKNARELLASEGNSASGLIPTEVYATIMEGSEPARCMRNVIPIYQMKSAVQKIPLGETGTYAPVVAEGAEIPALDEVPTVMTFTAAKYAVRPNITKEMVSDCTYDVIARNINKSGQRVENSLNQVALSAILEASGTAVDGAASTSDAVTLADLAKCISGVVTKGFTPTDIVFHPTCYGSILAAFTALATNTGDRLVNSGQIGSLLGCNTNICAVTDTSATYTWGWVPTTTSVPWCSTATLPVVSA